MPKLVSVEQHKIRGTYRPDRHANKLTIPPDGPGRCPRWLEKEGREEWKRIVEHPEYGQILSEIDHGALLEYCSLFARMVQTAKGQTTMSASERQTLNSLRMQLGLTPISRGKLDMPARPQAESKFAKFLDPQRRAMAELVG